jgi:hypothetical protein
VQAVACNSNIDLHGKSFGYFSQADDVRMKEFLLRGSANADNKESWAIKLVDEESCECDILVT